MTIQRRNSKRRSPEAKAEYLKRLNEYYDELRADPEAWEEELQERRLWDIMLTDGLPPE